MRGIGLVEVLVVVGILGIGLLGIGTLAAQGTRVMAAAADRYEAVLYAREAVEAIKALRNDSWDEYIEPLQVDTDYYLQQSASGPLRWELTTIDPGPLYGRPQNFVRTIRFERVYRDGNGDPAPVGDEDTHVRRAIIAISWETRGGVRSIESSTYVGDLF
ncbi:MAG: hypothetical protein A2806_04685 [Candidatus Terrybacteria bacterium RIFCSPHIGHO2_01_FULL_48_17]|uniref:Type II secretion system protein GspI C-terminal domain-containing protein n=1 Tax=Candidatus Terrybacteria bacterium RIFCSPHIGHO2_01_FULL_48_17 TaxID=1802362 RepID=A0A1G2PKY5_9BACT|nr:MAG: hypothetical protein A2806_04685 [Candidatus Terrybacteria bacterium RIFCSPHIGHO2_01_FULL_48_17]OHA52096.1 MAG: hypothetical protein A3A30_04300 [Candidatus Terrybacteria bacterium RIFCSPLOWO2_01_FULL_48_14]